MKNIGLAAAGLLASTAIATAGGLDRDQMGTSILFEEGNYVEIGFTSVNAEVSGTGRNAPIASGDIAPRYSFSSFGYHNDITDRFSLSLLYNQPYGANIGFATQDETGDLGTYWPFHGTTAELTSRQLSLMGRLDFGNGWSGYGGLRLAEASVNASVDATSFTYQLDAETDTATGYLVGAAFERPEIALRVALTYFSSMNFSFTGSESLVDYRVIDPNATPPVLLPFTSADTNSMFDVEMPESLLLEVQSGIAENTLVFGSVRWTGYAGTRLTPNHYADPDTDGQVGGSMATFDNDVFTYNLGIGRRINESWAVSASLGYEASQGTESGNLTPTDGRRTIGFGAEYSLGNMSIAGGIQYILIGDTFTSLGALGSSDYSDNTGIAAGIRIGVQF